MPLVPRKAISSNRDSVGIPFVQAGRTDFSAITELGENIVKFNDKLLAAEEAATVDRLKNDIDRRIMERTKVIGEADNPEQHSLFAKASFAQLSNELEEPKSKLSKTNAMLVDRHLQSAGLRFEVTVAQKAQVLRTDRLVGVLDEDLSTLANLASEARTAVDRQVLESKASERIQLARDSNAINDVGAGDRRRKFRADTLLESARGMISRGKGEFGEAHMAGDFASLTQHQRDTLTELSNTAIKHTGDEVEAMFERERKIKISTLEDGALKGKLNVPLMNQWLQRKEINVTDANDLIEMNKKRILASGGAGGGEAEIERIRINTLMQLATTGPGQAAAILESAGNSLKRLGAQGMYGKIGDGGKSQLADALREVVSWRRGDFQEFLREIATQAGITFPITPDAMAKLLLNPLVKQYVGSPDGATPSDPVGARKALDERTKPGTTLGETKAKDEAVEKKLRTRGR